MAMPMQPQRVPPTNNSRGWWRLLSVFSTYLIITIIVVILVNVFMGQGSEFFSDGREEVDLTELVESIKAGEVEKVTVNENELVATFKSGVEKISHKEPTSSLVEVLSQSGVENPTEKVHIKVSTSLWNGFLGLALSNLLPILVMILFFFFLFRQAGRTAGGMFDIGKSTARLFDRKSQKVTFKDAAGVQEAKKELEEVVDFLKNPDKYRKLGARIPKGVLLVGPAGTGKTLLARAVANEANVPFYSMAGSEFMEMLVGVGASRVRDLFKNAKATAPALIFIDEIESIGRQRGATVVASHGEQEQTLNQILVEMDGFTPNDYVIVLAATNRPDMLDPALTRPGRFDRQVMLQLPDIEGREEIIKIHMQGKPIAKDVEINRLARRTVGFSGADIENMLNEAAILTASEGRHEIIAKDIEESITKVKLGRESRRIQSDEDKKMTAYHEAGHAIVAKRLPGMDPVHRVSIVSRGLALGFTEINPDGDRYHQTKSDLLNTVTALMGGRAAEELIFNDMTVGAGNDLEKASAIAYRMVTEYGMSDLGPIAFTEKTLMSRTVNPFMDSNKYSEQMGGKIDDEVKKFIDQSFKQAQEILLQERQLLDKIADELMEQETLEQEEFERLVGEVSPSK